MAKKFLNKIPIGSGLKVLLISLLLIAGIVGMIISYINPVTWVQPYVSACMEFYITACWIEPTLIYTNGIVASLNSNWIPTLATSIGLIILALLQPEVRRGIRSFPRKVINAYRKVIVWRDKAFRFIEALNSESKKWKTAFNILKSPYSLLRACGVSPQLAVTFLSIGSVAGGGAIVNETILSERSFSNGDSGVYAAPLDAPTFFDDKDNTLQINLGIVPVREITIENVSVGTVYTGNAAGSEASILPSGKTEAILISGNPTVVDPAFTATRLEIGTFIFEKSRCKSVDVSDADIHTVIIEHNASDGQSIIQTSGNARNRAIGGGHHQAEAMITSGGTYDRIWIDAPSSGVNGKIGTLTLSNIYTRGGTCSFRNMDIGTLIIRQNEIGNDQDLATKEFQITSTVTGANWTVTDNVELTMSEPATLMGNP